MAQFLTPLIGEGGTESAQKLIAKFGTLSRVVSASPEALENALGIHNPAVGAICAARALVMCGLHEQLVGQTVDTHDTMLHDYLRAVLLNYDVERLHVIFLDHEARYLKSETLAFGTVTNLAVRVRKLVHRALDLGSSKILIAHNHPSGVSTPSAADKLATEQLRSIGSALAIELVDHLIVSSSGIHSLKEDILL